MPPESRKEIWTEPVLGLNRLRLISRCQDAIAGGKEDSFVYLVATRPLLDSIIAGILDGERVQGCGELRVFLFDGLVRSILKHTDRECHFLDDGKKRFLLGRILGDLNEVGALGYLSNIAHMPGTIESMAAVIGEVKRAGMAPEAFREFITTDRPQPRDLDIAVVYEAYQDILNSRRLMDSDEATSMALDLLRGRPDFPAWLDTIDTFFIDGFFDFTPVQKEFLRYLIERTREVIINFSCDPRQPSVFQEPLHDMFIFLESLSQPMSIHHSPRMLRCHPALGHLHETLFGPSPTRSSLVPPISLLTGASPANEIEEVAREIKRLIVEDSIAPENIGVIAREPSEYLKSIHDELRRCDIPVNLRLQVSLSSIPSVKSALKILACRAGWENTEPYISLLKNDYLEYFSPIDRDAVAGAVTAVGSQVPIRLWRKRLREFHRLKLHERETLSERLDDVEQVELRQARVSLDLAQLEGALKALDGIREALNLIPEQGTMQDLVRGWIESTRAFGLQQRLQVRLRNTGVDEEALRVISLDLQGLEAWYQTINETTRLDHAGQQAVEPPASPTGDDRSKRQSDTEAWITVDRFHQLMTQVLQRTPVLADPGDPGGVRLLEVTQARHLPFSVVFIVGLTQGSFPLSAPRDWVYPRAERERLAEAGLYLEDLSPRAFVAKEELFFYLAASQATDRLYFTYPRADTAGEPTVVSNFVREVCRLYSDSSETGVSVRHVRPNTHDIRRIASKKELAHRVMAGLTQPSGDDGFVLRAYNHAVSGNMIPSTVFDRLRIEKQRQGPVYGPYDGMLSDARILAQLNRRFGPDRTYSASQLNTYGRCPFQFFCERILKLEERQEPSLDLLALDRGRLLHRILYRFFERHLDSYLLGPRREELHRELDEIADELLQHYEQTQLPIHIGLWELEKQQILETLRQFLDAEMRYQENVSPHLVTPHWLELGFGMTSTEDCHRDSTTDPFLLPGEEDVIRLRGRIDRIDRSADGKYLVYDYKSGSGSTLAEMEDGVDVQIALYILVMAEMFLGAGEEVVGGGYYSLKNLSRNNGIYRKEFQPYTGINRNATASLSTEAYSSLLSKAIDFCWEYVMGMRHGDFRVHPKSDWCCPACTFKTVCRFEKHRIGGKG